MFFFLFNMKTSQFGFYRFYSRVLLRYSHIDTRIIRVYVVYHYSYSYRKQKYDFGLLFLRVIPINCRYCKILQNTGLTQTYICKPIYLRVRKQVSITQLHSCRLWLGYSDFYEFMTLHDAIPFYIITLHILILLNTLRINYCLYTECSKRPPCPVCLRYLFKTMTGRAFYTSVSQASGYHALAIPHTRYYIILLFTTQYYTFERTVQRSIQI